MSSKVVIYRHVNFQGASQELDKGNYDIASLAIGNDSLSSLQVPPGMKVTLYEHAGFMGRSQTYTEDSAWVGLSFNDKTSSIKVETILKPVYQYRAETPAWRYMYSTNPALQDGWIQDGIAFFASEPSENTVPIYQFVASTPYYRYQYSVNQAVDGPGWLSEGVAFYAYEEQRPGTTPVYQYYADSNSARRYLYSTIPSIQNGWTNEGAAFYVADMQP